MKAKQPIEKTTFDKTILFLYGATIAIMALTGFGQMPIYKRYYLADIPGLAWLTDFYITRYIHYIGAAILFALLAYLILNYLILLRKTRQVTAIGYAGMVLLAGIVVTGIFYIIKNLPGTVFSPGAVYLINLGHMALAVLFLALCIFSLLFRKRWSLSR